MSEIKTIKEWLKDIITGKVESSFCAGTFSGFTHEVIKYQLVIGKSVFSYFCPVCGFGTGGMISEEDAKELFDLQIREGMGKDG